MYTLKKLYSKEPLTKYRKISNSPLPMMHSKQGTKELKTMEQAKTNAFQGSLMVPGPVHPTKAHLSAADLKTSRFQSLFTTSFSIPTKYTEYTSKAVSSFHFLKTTALLLVFCTLFCATSHADVLSSSECNKIVQAIFLAEGGNNTRHPYGILSVKTKSKEEARQVCTEVVRWRYAVWSGTSLRNKSDFITYLSKSYCPVGAENDPTGLNNHWKKNVKFFLEKEEKQRGLR